MTDPVALAALLLSAVISLINAYYVVRHAEIEVRPPQQVLIYRDGELAAEEGAPDPALMTVAVQLPMVNMAAQDHGDMLVDASIRLPDGTRFPFESAIEPIFVADTQSVECELEVRCVRLSNLLILQKWNQVFDLPGGMASARYLSFPVHSSYCESDAEQACAGYDTFRASVASLPSEEATIAIELEFAGDGTRHIECAIAPAGATDRGNVIYSGWTVLPCENGEVSGAPIL